MAIRRAGSRNVPFDHDKPEYRCCFHALHAKTAAYAIALISTFFIVASFVLKAIGLSDIGWNWELLFLVVDSVAVICLLQGLWQEKAALLQPFVVLNIITISFLILLTLFFATAVLNAHSYAGEYVEMALSGRLQQIAEVLSVQQRNVIPLLAAFAVVALALAVAVNVWFLVVIVRCARYFRDLEPFKKSFMSGYSAEALTDPSLFSQRHASSNNNSSTIIVNGTDDDDDQRVSRNSL